jgi:hypothetical protein
LKTAKIVILLAILVIIAINIPYLLFYTIVEVKSATDNITTKCSAINSNFVLYGNYFVRPILLGILPGTVLIITGLLTYRNITSIANIQLRGTFQRSLTSMILVQIIVVVMPIIPFATIDIYQTVTSSMVKTPYRLAQETLAMPRISRCTWFRHHLIDKILYTLLWVVFVKIIEIIVLV